MSASHPDSMSATAYKSAVNTLTREDRARILRLFREGSSIRAITGVTGASKNTVVKLLIAAGAPTPYVAGQAAKGPPR